MRTLTTGSNDAAGSVGAASLRIPATMNRTTTDRARLGIVSSSSGAELVLQRQLPDSLAGRSEDRVGQRGCRDRRTRLADPARRLEVAHQMHIDRRRLIHPQHANVMEVRLLHPA